MKELWDLILVWFSNLFGLEQRQTSLIVAGTPTETIINPRLSGSHDQIIIPVEYEFTLEEAFSVVRTHDYIYVHPIHRDYVEEGE